MLGIQGSWVRFDYCINGGARPPGGLRAKRDATQPARLAACLCRGEIDSSPVVVRVGN